MIIVEKDEIENASFGVFNHSMINVTPTLLQLPSNTSLVCNVENFGEPCHGKLKVLIISYKNGKTVNITEGHCFTLNESGNITGDDNLHLWHPMGSQLFQNVINFIDELKSIPNITNDSNKIMMKTQEPLSIHDIHLHQRHDDDYDDCIIFDLQDFEQPFVGCFNALFGFVSGLLLAQKTGFKHVMFTGFPLNFDSTDVISLSVLFCIQKLEIHFPQIKIHFANHVPDTRQREFNSSLKYAHEPTQQYTIITEKLRNRPFPRRVYFGCIFTSYYFHKHRDEFNQCMFNILQSCFFYQEKNSSQHIPLVIHYRNDDDMMAWLQTLGYSSQYGPYLERLYELILSIVDIFNIPYYICSSKKHDKQRHYQSFEKTPFREINALCEFCLTCHSTKFIGFESSTFSIIHSLFHPTLMITKQMIEQLMHNENQLYFTDQLIDDQYRLIRSFGQQHQFISETWFQSFPRLGIGIASYERRNGKSRQYLKNALLSLQNQIYKNFSIFLVGDDVSDSYFQYMTTLCQQMKLSYTITNNKNKNERHKLSMGSVELWNVAGACSVNVSIEKMQDTSIVHYVHMDDDNVFQPWHLFHIAFAYKTLDASVVFTQGLQSTTKLPIIPNHPKIYKNNLPLQPRNMIHSCLSFRIDRIPCRYIDIFEQPDWSVPADARLEEDIQVFCNHHPENSIVFFPICTVYEHTTAESMIMS